MASRLTRAFLLVLVGGSTCGAEAAGWSAGTPVSPTGNPDPTRGAQTNTVAVNAAGLAVAAWDQYFYTNGGGSTIGVNVETKGRWGTPFTLSDPAKYCDRATAALGGDGTIVVAWACQDSSYARTIEAAVRPGGSTQWSAPFVLASGSTRVSPDPSNVRVAMNANGEAWVAWSIFDGANYVVEAAYRPIGGDFETPITLSTPGVDAIQPSLAINEPNPTDPNDTGDVAIAWSGSPWNMASPNTITVAKSAGGGASFDPPVQVAPLLSSYGGYQINPSICLDRSGRAMVMWFGAGLQANWENTQGDWDWTPGDLQAPTSIITASNNISSYLTPSLTCDSTGNAIAAVTIFDPSAGVQRAQLWARTFDAATGTWSTDSQGQDRATKLTGNNPRKTEDIAASNAAMSPDGKLAYVAYVDHYNGVVKAIHHDATGWGSPFSLGKVSSVSGFAEVVNASADDNAQGRVIWKTKGGMVHMVSDWRP